MHDVNSRKFHFTISVVQVFAKTFAAAISGRFVARFCKL